MRKWKYNAAELHKLTSNQWAADNLPDDAESVKFANQSIYDGIQWARELIESNPSVSPAQIGQECFDTISTAFKAISKWGFSDSISRIRLAYLIERYLELPPHSIAQLNWLERN